MFPFIYAFAEQTFDASSPRYVFVLAPVLVLLVAQLATTHLRTAAIVAVGCVSTIVTLHKMSLVRDPMPHAPRNIAPLIATLDRLKLDRVYADLWAAYVIDFDSRERILAVENKFDDVSFLRGRAVAPGRPRRARPRVRAEGARGSRPRLRLLPEDGRQRADRPGARSHGYRRVNVGPFVVFAPPTA